MIPITIAISITQSYNREMRFSFLGSTSSLILLRNVMSHYFLSHAKIINIILQNDKSPHKYKSVATRAKYVKTIVYLQSFLIIPAMSFRYRKSKKIMPGVRINMSKNSISTSFGRKGASINVGKRGTFLNIGIPGTGLSFRQRLNSTRTNKLISNNKSEKNTEASKPNKHISKESILKLIKYCIGFLAIYIVFNWTIIFYNSNEWPLFLVFIYFLLLIVILLIFHKPVLWMFKKLIGYNQKARIHSNSEVHVSEHVSEESKRLLSNIIREIKNNNSSDDDSSLENNSSSNNK